MSRASTLVRSARKSRSLTQVDLAEQTQVHQSNISDIEGGRDLSVSTLEKLLRGTGHRLFALPIQKADVTEAASAIRVHLKAGNTQGALRVLIQLNDNLVSEHGLGRGVLGLCEPEPAGNQVWDAALAGLVAWRLSEENIPLPTWVNKPRFFLRLPRTLRIDAADPIPAISDIPPEFARRGVLVWADTFESV
jgi:transcriptional regulator with XRE-family HTH domain